MEEYINTKTIIEDEIYKAFKQSVTCPICNNILIEPLICMKCQKIYCKKCINSLTSNNQKCPNGCLNPFFENCLGIIEILSKLKFKCKKCEKQIEYKEVQEHYEFHSKKDKEKKDKEKKDKRKKNKEKKEKDKKNKEIKNESNSNIKNENSCITSKKIIFF